MAWEYVTEEIFEAQDSWMKTLLSATAEVQIKEIFDMPYGSRVLLKRMLR